MTEFLRRGGCFVAAALFLASLPLVWASATARGFTYEVTAWDFVAFWLITAVCAITLIGAGLGVVLRNAGWGGVVACAVGILSIVFALVSMLLIGAIAGLIPDLADHSDLGRVETGEGLWVVLAAGLVAVTTGTVTVFASGSIGTVRRLQRLGKERGAGSRRVEAVLRVMGGDSIEAVSGRYGFGEEELRGWRDEFIHAGSRAIG